MQPTKHTDKQASKLASCASQQTFHTCVNVCVCVSVCVCVCLSVFEHLFSSLSLSLSTSLSLDLFLSLSLSRPLSLSTSLCALSVSRLQDYLAVWREADVVVGDNGRAVKVPVWDGHAIAHVWVLQWSNAAVRKARLSRQRLQNNKHAH